MEVFSKGHRPREVDRGSFEVLDIVGEGQFGQVAKLGFTLLD